MSIPIFYQLAGGYFLVSVLGGGTYAWLKFHRFRQRPPSILRYASGLHLSWRGQVYTSVDAYTWARHGQTVSRRKAAQLRKLVEQYGWRDA